MILLLTFTITALMTGIVWFVQINNYPLLLKIGRLDFINYEKEHTKRASWLISPLMLVELALSFALVLYNTQHLFHAAIALILLIIIWLSTFALQVPLHQKLSREHNAALIKKLISTNWIRTVLWSLRLIILGAMIADKI